MTKGWYKESRRHSLARRGIKTSNLSKSKITGNELFKFQDTNQEKIIHSGWKEGNSFRYMLEGSGDVFRELTKEKSHSSYIEEKLKRIENYIKKVKNPPKWNEYDQDVFNRLYGLDPKKTGIHPEDSYEYALKNNPQKFKRLKEKWQEQKHINAGQMYAKKLNLALLDNDLERAEKYIKLIRFNKEIDL